MRKPYEFFIEIKDSQYSQVRKILDPILEEAESAGRHLKGECMLGTYYIFGGLFSESLFSLGFLHDTEEGLEEMLRKVGYKKANPPEIGNFNDDGVDEFS